jgi:hypothetical protein
MQKVIAFLAIAAVLVFAGAAFASDLTSEPAQFAGHIYVDAQTGNIVYNTGADPSAAAGTDVYSNVLSAANAAISSTSLTSIWGDRFTTTGVGVLSQNDLTIYNSSSSLGSLLTCNVSVSFFNGATSAFIGGYSGTITFGTGLGVGFYTIVTFINLETLVTPINLSVNDIIETQTVTSKTGTANRLGVASLDPVTVGLGTVSMYINSSTIGAPGYYNIVAGNSNPGYRVNVFQAVPTTPTTWGKVKSLYR